MKNTEVFFLEMDMSREEREDRKARERGKEGKSNEAERRGEIGVNGMATEKRSIAVVWKNVRKMRPRERQSEIMDWIERSNCDICAVNETGLTNLTLHNWAIATFILDESL